MIAETEIRRDDMRDAAKILSDEAFAQLRRDPAEYAARTALLAEPPDPLVEMAIAALAEHYEGRTVPVEELIVSSSLWQLDTEPRLSPHCSVAVHDGRVRGRSRFVLFFPRQ